MHPAFATIVYGPFHTAYHQGMTGPEFREQLSDFLEEQLIPQLEEPFLSTEGKLTAAFNEEKYCGPNSAVKDRYELEFCFQGESGRSDVRASLRHDPVARRFLPHGKKGRLLLVTPRLHAVRQAFEKDVSQNLRKYWKTKWAGGPCPACGLPLEVHKGNYHFVLRCPGGCVDYCVMS